MKTLIAIFSLVMGQAFAARISSASSWESINASRRHIVEAPMIAGGFFNVCTDGENFNTVNPVKVCVEGRHVQIGHGESYSGWEYVCTKYELRHLSTSRTTVKQVCTAWTPANEASNGECTRWEDRTVTAPLSYKLEVKTDRGEAGYMTEFVKSYTIPACN
ncbi:MAG: hypothetical protein Fur0010_14060 [Bdellovibrio sp.]